MGAGRDDSGREQMSGAADGLFAPVATALASALKRLPGEQGEPDDPSRRRIQSVLSHSLRFVDGWDEESTHFLRSCCLSAMWRAERDFACELPPVEVVAYSDESAMRSSSSFLDREAPATGVAACYDGALRITRLQSGRVSRPRLLTLLTHELTHHAVRVLSKGRAPVFLDEGLAMARSQAATGRHDRLLRSARQSGSLLSLERLAMPFPDLAERHGEEAADLAEAQSLTIAWFLLRAPGGWSRVRLLLKRLSEGEMPTDSFEACELFRDALGSTDPEALIQVASRRVYDAFLEETMGLKDWLVRVADWIRDDQSVDDKVAVSRILSELLDRAEREALILVDGRVLPDRYEVKLSRNDFARLGGGLRGLIETELASRLQTAAAKRHDRRATEPQVELKVGAALAVGAFEVEASFKGTLLPAPSRLVPEEEIPDEPPSPPGKEPAAPEPVKPVVRGRKPSSEAGFQIIGWRLGAKKSGRSDVATRLAPDGAVYLSVVSGPEKGTDHPISPGMWSFGRGTAADFFLGDDERISREHFVLDVKEDGSTTLIDKSANGTQVDGRKITDSLALESGARICVGGVEIVFGRDS